MAQLPLPQQKVESHCSTSPPPNIDDLSIGNQHHSHCFGSLLNHVSALADMLLHFRGLRKLSGVATQAI